MLFRSSTDIDVYFRSWDEYCRFVYMFERDYVFSRGHYRISSDTENAVSYETHFNNKDWNVQLIKKRFYRTIEEVLDDFDITVCKIGYDGNRVVTRSTFIDDEATKTLRFDAHNPMSHKRLVKYMAYGYEPAPGEIARLCQSANIDWDAKRTDHYA